MSASVNSVRLKILDHCVYIVHSLHVHTQYDTHESGNLFVFTIHYRKAKLTDVSEVLFTSIIRVMTALMRRFESLSRM